MALKKPSFGSYRASGLRGAFWAQKYKSPLLTILLVNTDELPNEYLTG
jgi:hypothetical protein